MSHKQSSVSKRRQDEQTQIYDYDGEIRVIYKNIDKNLSSRTSKLIRQYDQVMINTPLAKATRRKHLQTVYSLSKFLGKDWHEVTKLDIQDLVSRIMTEYADVNGQESNSSYDNKKILRIFFRWFKLGSRESKEVGDPEETKWIKLKRVKDKIVRESLLDEKDIANILANCSDNIRDRAFLDVHYEAGTRPGEMLSLRIKHVKFDDYGAVIHVDGKTGARPVRLVKSTPNLALWYDAHPFKENPEAPLWIMTEPKFYGKQMTYASASQMLYRICKKAKITKRITLNLFRHSEATRTATFMTEAHMRKRHGWSLTSRMPARYVHLVNSDVDEAIFKHLGIVKDKQQDKTLPKTCHTCKMSNPYESSICIKCGKPLNLEFAIRLEEKEKKEKETLQSTLDEIRVKLANLETEKGEAKKKILENMDAEQLEKLADILTKKFGFKT